MLAVLLPALATAGACRAETLLDFSDPPPPPADEVVVSKIDLGRLTGTYANKDMGFAFQLDLQGKRLRLTFTEGPKFAPSTLIPTSTTEFRVEGEGLAPGLKVRFHVPEGKEKATSLTVLQPNMPEVVMKRMGETPGQ
jgi:hypothetical protein